MAEVPESMTRANGRFSGRGETISRIGVLVSAVMASACCWLPLVLLAVGVSGAGIAAALEVYRPLFIVVTFGLLAAAFYFTYRPKPAGAKTDHACCAADSTPSTGDCCAPSNNRRFNMMTTNKIMLWLITVLAVGFLFFPNYVGTWLGANDGPAIGPEMNRAVVKIEGMTCEGCAAVAEQALRSVPGVLAVDVNYEQGEAVLGIGGDHAVPRDDIVTALKLIGYLGRMEQDNGPK